MSDPSANDPGVISKILKGFNSAMTDPNNAGTMGFAQGLLQASAPHMLTPVSGGQALGMGAAASQEYQQQALKNAMMRATVPFQQMKTGAFARAFATMNDPHASPQDKVAAKALLYSMIGGQGLGTAMYTSDPSVAGPKQAALSQNTPHNVPASDRVYGPVGGQSVNAQGALPTGVAQGPAPGTPGGPQLGSLDLRLMPGAAQAIQGSAANQSFGSSQGALPAQVAAARAAPHVLAPGTTMGSMNAGSGLSPQVAAMLGIGAKKSPLGGQRGPSAQGGQPVSGPGVRTGMSLSTATGLKANQEQATTAMNADIAAAKDRQQRVANLEELNAVASGLKTGPGMDAHVAVLKALASIPGAVGASVGKLQTITDAQIFNKTALNLSLQTVSSAGQHAYDAFKSVMNAFPELSKTPLANAVVTGSLLATARYEADKSQYAANWQQANGMGYVQGKGSYDASWAKNASFMSYFLGALPPAARAQLFQKARSNATLRSEINQAAKSDAWLKANGY